MNFQTTILLISFGVAVILALIIIPILKKLKARPNRKRRWPTITLKKTRYTNNGGHNIYAINWHMYSW